jgi:hypothetical protein
MESHWLVTAGITVLFGIIAFWVKRWINMQDRLQEDWLRQGGVVTREKFGFLCEQARSNCIAGNSYGALCDWRENIMEKGGPLTKGEHTAICKEITKEVANHFSDRIEELFDHHREWVGQELKLIAQEQGSIRDLLKRQIKTEAGRWDQHSERIGKPSSPVDE